MKCSECKCCVFAEDKSGVNRYYCEHPEAAKAVNAGARMIARTKRHSKELTVKASPRWCPLKNEVTKPVNE